MKELTSDTVILLLTYGTPRYLGEVKEYFSAIRKGPVREEEVAELTARYEAIGGLSPLTAHVERQRELLEELLVDTEYGACSILVASRYGKPSILEVVEKLVPSTKKIIAIPLSPFFSSFSTTGYIHALEKALEIVGSQAEVEVVKDFALTPSFEEYWSEALREMLKKVQKPYHVFFTAHSLPINGTEEDDYAQKFQRVVASIAAKLGLPSHTVAWQSGRSTGWYGPCIEDCISTLKDSDKGAVVIAPIGFTSEHLEVLYDLDIVCRNLVEEKGLDYLRVPMPNDSARYMESVVEALSADTHRGQM